MQYWVYHQGVPLGSAELHGGELAVAAFEPTDAYLSIQELIREASAAVWNVTFGIPEGFQGRVSSEALTKAAQLPLELRDEEGRLVSADFVNLVEPPNSDEGPVVFARFRHSHTGVTSELPPRNAKGGGTVDPDA